MPIEDLYNALTDTVELPSLDEFKLKMQNARLRKALYDNVSPQVDLGTYEQFETKSLEDIYGSPVNQFVNGLWTALWPETKAGYNDVVGDFEGANAIRKQAQMDDPINPDSNAAATGKFLGALLPSAAALAVALFSPEPTTKYASAAFLTHMGLLSAGSGRRAVDVYEHEHNVDVAKEDEYLVAAGAGAITMLVERVGLGAMTTSITKRVTPGILKSLGAELMNGSKGKAGKIAAELIGPVVTGFGIEGVEGGAEQLFTNILKEAVYDEHVNALDNVTDSFLMEGLGGAILGGAGGLAYGMWGPKTKAAEPVSLKGSPKLLPPVGGTTDAHKDRSKINPQYKETNWTDYEVLYEVDKAYQAKQDEITRRQLELESIVDTYKTAQLASTKGKLLTEGKRPLQLPTSTQASPDVLLELERRKKAELSMLEANLLQLELLRENTTNAIVEKDKISTIMDNDKGFIVSRVQARPDGTLKRVRLRDAQAPIDVVEAAETFNTRKFSGLAGPVTVEVPLTTGRRRIGDARLIEQEQLRARAITAAESYAIQLNERTRQLMSDLQSQDALSQMGITIDESQRKPSVTNALGEPVIQPPEVMSGTKKVVVTSEGITAISRSNVLEIKVGNAYKNADKTKSSRIIKIKAQDTPEYIAKGVTSVATELNKLEGGDGITLTADNMIEAGASSIREDIEDVINTVTEREYTAEQILVEDNVSETGNKSNEQEIMHLSMVADATNHTVQSSQESSPVVVPLNTLVEDVRRGTDNTEKLYAMSQSLLDATKAALGFIHKLGDSLSIEYRFKRFGGKLTGLAMKHIPAMVLSHQEVAYRTLKKIADVCNHDRGLLMETVLCAETPSRALSLLNDRNITQAEYDIINKSTKIVNDYFDHYATLLQSKGIMKDSFEEQMLGDVMQIAKDQFYNATSKNAQLYWGGVIKALKNGLDLRYVHIPLGAWFKNKTADSKVQHMQFDKLNKFMTQHTRRTVYMSDLLKAGVITTDDIDIATIMSSYATEVGRDLAAANLRDAGLADGLILTKAQHAALNIDDKALYVDDLMTNAVFKGYKLHSALIPTMYSVLMQKKPYSAYEKFMAVCKGFAFYNPLYLPVLSILQASTVHGIKTVKMLPGLKEAWISCVNKDAKYLDALRNGTFATISFNPWQNHISMARDIMKSRKDLVADHIYKLLSPRIITELYSMSSTAAWFMDNVVRMSSYNLLIKEGHTPRDAGALTAKASADYADVPEATRRTLNKVFITPTYKLATGHYMWQTMEAYFKPDRLTMGDKGVKKMRWALINMAAMLLGHDILMRTFGYKREVFGVKYVKEINTPEGPKEIVHSFNTPSNMFLKFAGRAYRAGAEPGLTNRLQSFVESNRWEYAPAFNTASDLVKNESRDGQLIYNPLDDTSVKWAKMARYSVTSIIQLFTALDQSPMQVKVEQALKINNEYSAVMEMLGGLVDYKYIRAPRAKRAVYKLKGLHDYLIKAQKDGTVTEAMYRNYEKECNSIINQLESAQYEGLESK